MSGRDPAEARLWWLALARLAAILLTLPGLFLAASAAGDWERRAAGLALMLAGLALFLLLPRWLRRRWER